MSERVCLYLAQHNIISSDRDQIEIYAYGLKQLMVMAFNMITTFMLGFMFDMVLEVFVFMAAYVPIRSYAGGFHLNTQVRCYFGSIVMIVIVLYLISLLQDRYMLSLLIAALSGIIVIFLAPVEDQNKPLSSNEKVRYGKKTKRFTIIAFLAAVVGTFIGRKELCMAVSMALCTLSVMLIMGIVKNRWIKSGEIV